MTFQIDGLDEILDSIKDVESTGFTTPIPENVPLLAVLDKLEEKYNETTNSYGFNLHLIVNLNPDSLDHWDDNAKTAKSVNYVYLGKRYGENATVEFPRESDGKLKAYVVRNFVTFKAFGLGQDGNNSMDEKNMVGRVAVCTFKHEEYNGNTNARIDRVAVAELDGVRCPQITVAGMTSSVEDIDPDDLLANY